MGGIISYRYRGREMLKTMLVPSFWRAATDNDRGCKAPVRFAQWKLAQPLPREPEPRWAEARRTDLERPA